VFNPDGSEMQVYAYGIRNCVGLGMNPLTGELWCSTNERDGLGDNLVPDYITHVQEGGSTAGRGGTWAVIRIPGTRASIPSLRTRSLPQTSY